MNMYNVLYVLSVQPSTRWRARVGTAYFAIGGTVLTIAHITIHPEFSVASSNTDDLAVIRTSTPILFTTSAARATLAHMDFGLPSGQDVAAVGWGLLRVTSENLSLRQRCVSIFWNEGYFCLFVCVPFT